MSIAALNAIITIIYDDVMEYNPTVGARCPRDSTVAIPSP